ncbi:MAG: ABC transporter permease [Bacteroidales bacterium]|nr:ABC transporter permease [Bacteroidales bacterium]
MKSSSSNRNLTIAAVSVTVLFALWSLAAGRVGSEHILPGPWQTLVATVQLFGEKSFLAVVGHTLLRGLIGFAIAVAAGLGLGIAGGLSDGVNAFMRPWVVIMRSTPVVAFILLALIWFKNDSVPVFIGILTMFPMVYINIVDGIRSVDGKIVEMARFYGIERPRMVREVYLPAIAPFVVSGISSAVGIGWRAIVVGEVLSQPRYGIGTVMHSAQTFLQVDILIAWTFVAIVLGALFEWIIRLAEKRILKWK